MALGWVYWFLFQIGVPGYPPPGYPTQGYAMPYGGYGQHPGYSTAPMVNDWRILYRVSHGKLSSFQPPARIAFMIFFKDFMKVSTWSHGSKGKIWSI